jgi:hypothetical protein
VQTAFYPLYEIEKGRLNITKRVATVRPLTEYFKAQQRYVPFPPELLALVQEVVREEYEKIIITYIQENRFSAGNGILAQSLGSLSLFMER